jgi:hypothetical protein
MAHHHGRNPEMETALAALDTLYVTRHPSTGHAMLVVCSPETRLSSGEMETALAALRNLDCCGVYDVRQSSERGYGFAISVSYHNSPTDDNRVALHTLLGARLYAATASASVIRDAEGKHRDTVMKLFVPKWAYPSLVEKLEDARSDRVVAQLTVQPCSNNQSLTVVGFTTATTTRDPERIRGEVATVAVKLGICVTNLDFTVDDNLTYAAMPSCNHPEDPMDRLPGDGA